MNIEQPVDLAGWRDQAADNSLKGAILGKISRRDRLRRARALAWGFVCSGVGIAALTAFVLLSTTGITLAQVIAADQKAVSLTIVNRRIMGAAKAGGFTITTWVLGDQARTEVQLAASKEPTRDFYHIDREQTIWYRAGLNLAVYDGKFKNQERALRAPRASELLRDFKAARVEAAHDWNGRTVTRFTYNADVANTGVDQELLVDPDTKLPIKFTSMRDHGSWGDEWTYDYSKIDPSRVIPVIPQGTRVIDNRKQRAAMGRIARSSKGTVVMAEIAPKQIVVLVERSVVPGAGFTPFEIRLKGRDGSEKSYKGDLNLNISGKVRVGERDLVAILWSEHLTPWDERWFGETTVSGRVRIADKTYSFSELPAFATGDVHTLNVPFAEAYRAAHAKGGAP